MLAPQAPLVLMLAPQAPLGHVHVHPLLRRRRSTTTTVLGGSTTPIPHVSIRGTPPPDAATARASRSTSAGADMPFTASIIPPGQTSGRHHAASRCNGATARDV